MKKYTYDNIIEVLEKEFPEHKSYIAYEYLQRDNSLNLQYAYVDSLAGYIAELIEKNPNDIYVKKLFNLLNNVFDKKEDKNVEDLFGTELFEYWAIYSLKASKLAKSKLKGAALNSFMISWRDYGKKKWGDVL